VRKSVCQVLKLRLLNASAVPASRAVVDRAVCQATAPVTARDSSCHRTPAPPASEAAATCWPGRGVRIARECEKCTNTHVRRRAGEGALMMRGQPFAVTGASLAVTGVL
jgi:hypothetical protein